VICGYLSQPVEKTVYTLFGEETQINKLDKAANRIIDIYSNRLKTIWKYVSKPYEMKNSTNALMFHFLMISQNSSGKKIADEIIGKINRE
jgi:hypothetical protein